ncbi:uncharacterized protein LACBIDRAFT_314348 [Laccaria bicolor S238N-H82]|uniref:Predicted protein n=1 Tax=Laccaria bicolor (strain S238N-H82 / ATCC MYA-4686) TaxID=486041 RepID=B0DYC5_LACBS|nr:uncharacterized protein LACBIDRAFT_314348 [Laccaria bicolor S238N-H82]EDR00412.1 predicted protein [Laccaria bicolor S238N-H82]|eukprot:XP_001888971.1 predicted protein [Laccaria bicolor S238N-H82]
MWSQCPSSYPAFPSPKMTFMLLTHDPLRSAPESPTSFIAFYIHYPVVECCIGSRCAVIRLYRITRGLLVDFTQLGWRHVRRERSTCILRRKRSNNGVTLVYASAGPGY